MEDNKGLFFLFCIVMVMNLSYLSFAGEIGITEHLGETIPQNIYLVNEKGIKVDLYDQFTIPTILTFVYFDCPGVCTPLMNEIASIIDKDDLEAGRDYQFITISFDHSEGIDLAREKKANYLSTMKKPDEAEKGWLFFTGDSLNIAKITDVAGFHFEKTGNEFIHKTAMIFVNTNRQITRYNQGINLLPLELKMTIIEGEKGTTLPGMYKKDEYCYPFVVNAYQDLNNIAKVFGIMIISFAVGLFLYLVVKPRLLVKK